MKKYITPALLVRDIKISQVILTSGVKQNISVGSQGNAGDEAESKFLDFNFDDAE